MSELKLVPPYQGEVIPDCVQALEKALERAKRGETVGVMLVEQGPDHSASWNWGGYCGSYSTLGALQAMQANLVADHVDPT